MRLLNFLFLFIIPGILQAQISFYNKYAGNSFDRGEGVVQLPDSSYLITGSSTTFLEASSEAFIMHVDSTGKRLWTKAYGGNETDRGRRIFHVANDGIYVVGQSSSQTDNFYQAWWFKTDLNGELISENYFGGSDYENIHDAVMLKDTSIILVGESFSGDGQYPDIYLLRVDKAGTLLWEKTLGQLSQTEIAHAIALYNDTTVIIAGEAYNSANGIKQAYIHRMLIDGSDEWFRYYGFSDEQAFRDVHVYKDSIRTGGYYTKPGTTEHGYFCGLYDMNGNLYRDEMLPLDGAYEINNVQRFREADYVLSMSVKNAPAIPTFANGMDNIYYLYTNILFYNFAALNYSEPDDDIVNEIIHTNDNGILAVGYRSWDAEVQMTLLKVDGREAFAPGGIVTNNMDFVKVSELPETNFSVYPNPATKQLYVLGNQNILSLELKDMRGHTFLYEKGESLNVEQVPAGAYILTVETVEGKWQGKLMVSP